MHGDHDAGSPASRVRAIEQTTPPAKDLAERPAESRSVIYQSVEHSWTPETLTQRLAWLDRTTEPG
jgi:hypothetical protein